MAAVRRYDVLDTPRDGSFDRVTALAARLFEVPIAIVSIVDHDRIWFKSHHGTEAEEIEREPGLCASAILQYEPYVVSDAATDPRTLANPLVAGEMGLRFYAAAPLTTPDGFNLGTVCVLDTEPRGVSDEEQQTLRDLAAVVIDELELRRAARRLHEQEEERLADAERLATTLQRSLLPAGLPAIPGVELAAHFRAADRREVSGDFYDAFSLRDGVWGVALGDVAGKGAAAAAATSLVRYALRTAALSRAGPAAALSLVNEAMLRSEHFGCGRRPGYCTLVFAELDLRRSPPELTIARAGHERPLIVTPGAARPSAADGRLLGLVPDVRFTTETVTLPLGTSIVLYSDGLTEARVGGAALGERGLAELLAATPAPTAAALVGAIREFVETPATGIRDDVAVLAVGRPS